VFLCIDTATEEAGISLADESRGYGYLLLDRMKASEQILKNIDDLIQKSGQPLKDLQGVLAIKGPGSFTGLRVGVAVANQFAHQIDIPIMGLTTDQFFAFRTDEKDFLYLQSMNRDELYVKGFGSFEDQFKGAIVPIGQLPSDSFKWCGQLFDDHQNKLPDNFEPISVLSSPEEAWREAVKNTKWSASKKYELLEPYYGKAPTITKTKRRLTI